MACNCGYRKRIRDAKISFDPKRSVYLDYNATTPVDPAVLGEFDKVCRRLWGNPSSLHSAGIEIEENLERYTKTILNYLGLDSGRLYFCGSGTEAIHAGISGIARIFSDRNSRHIISKNTEHSAVKKPLRMLRILSAGGQLPAGNPVSILSVDSNGRLNPGRFEDRCKRTGPSLLVYSPVNHETGALQPVKELFTAAEQHGCLVFLDAVQACPRLAPEEWAPYCHGFAVSGHKIYAPKGTAALYIKKEIKLTPFRFGGSQQSGIFPGTENTPGIAALSRAFELLSADFAGEQARLRQLTKEGLDILRSAGIEFIVESSGWNAGGSRSADQADTGVPGVLCLSFPWIGNMEEAMFELDRRQICVSRFSACTSRIAGPSPVLLAMGRPKRRCETSLRISIGRFSKRDDFFRLAEVLRDLKGKS